MTPKLLKTIFPALCLSLMALSGCNMINTFLKDDKSTSGQSDERLYGSLQGLRTGATIANPTFSVATVGAQNLNVTMRHDTLIAIIDSGVDYTHNDLRSHMWRNANEIEANGIDDDHNNFIDDIYGWNFINNNAQIIDFKYQSTFTPDVRRFMEISAKRAKGIATSEDTNWFNSKRNDTNFMNQIDTYANYAHGTHVSGISTFGNPKVQISGLKMIATEQARVANAPLANTPIVSSGIKPTGTLDTILLVAVIGIVIAALLGGGNLGGIGGGGGNAQSLEPIFSYADKQGAAVANCSFGVTASAVQNVLNGYLQSQQSLQANQLNMINLAVQATANIGEQMAADISKAPRTLFVIAAGNESSNNDVKAAWPANVKAPNTITVAATLGRTRLAEFSNYGAQMVEVAAPGVAIRSTVPGNEYLEMSGTSMAAPYVTNVAAQIRSINPNLTPDQTKAILMGTVDKKSFLSGKVSTGGIVNAKRAVAAAELSVSQSLDAAIAQAAQTVADETEISDVLIRARSYSPGSAYIHSLVK